MTPNDRLERRLAKSLRRMPTPEVPTDLRERLMAPALEGSASLRRDWRRPLLLSGAAVLALAAWPASCSLFDAPPKAVAHNDGPAVETPEKTWELPAPSTGTKVASNREPIRQDGPAPQPTRSATRRTPGRTAGMNAQHPIANSAQEPMVVLVGRKVDGRPDLATVSAQDAGVTVRNESATTPSGTKRQKYTFRDANGKEATMSVEAHPAQPEEEEQPK